MLNNLDREICELDKMASKLRALQQTHQYNQEERRHEEERKAAEGMLNARLQKLKNAEERGRSNAEINRLKTDCNEANAELHRSIDSIRPLSKLFLAFV